ncbi:MAG: metallophosphoesterase family protein [Atopobiaceae bacterium]
MATYVISDIHGHVRAFDQLLNEVSPADDDQIWVLGDMIDRGPEPVEVLKRVRELSDGRVLMGNHEDLMCDYFLHGEEDPTLAINWSINGGTSTLEGLEKLEREEQLDLLEWVCNLPTAAHVRVHERDFLLVHAGLRSLGFSAETAWTDEAIESLLSQQSLDDALWIREDFWGHPLGFLDERGEGPIVIAGHTPVPYVENLADSFDRPARDEEGNCRMMRIGARPETAGVADRWAIDCGAAGGAGWGRVLMLRLDDEQEFYASIQEGE